MEYKLSDYKTAMAIVNRTWTMGKHFSRSQLFHPDFYNLYKPNIRFDEDELPIFECSTTIGYLLLTTKYLFVELQEQSHKIEVEKIVYQSRQAEILKRISQRHGYMEYDFYSLATTDEQLITYAVSIGYELILDKCLADVAWMVEKFRKVHLSE